VKKAILGALSLVFFAAHAVLAQSWPQKPMRLIVPFPPGGGNDLIGRIVAQSLTKRLGQNVIVDNRAGANGIIGLQALRQAPADGYTFATSSDGPLVINPAMYENLPYDVQKDFVAVALAIAQPIVLAAHPSLPVRSVPQLLALARAKPGAVSYSSFGVGNISHLSGELLSAAAGVRLLHVPYKGGEPAITALLSGEVQLMFGTAQNVLEHTRAGKLIALGTGEPAGRRLSSLPDVPAIADTVAGYETKTWNGFIAPANTPREIVERLSREIRAIVQEKDISANLVSIGTTPMPLGPDEFAALMRRDAEKWARLTKLLNIRAN
jgi:tripartite-type tricarboxylate transporter receptor subunit TctC